MSWVTIPNIKNRIKDYVVRTICAVLVRYLLQGDKAEELAKEVVVSTLRRLEEEGNGGEHVKAALEYINRHWLDELKERVVVRKDLVKIVQAFFFFETFATKVRKEDAIVSGTDKEREGYSLRVNEIEDRPISNPLRFLRTLYVIEGSRPHRVGMVFLYTRIVGGGAVSEDLHRHLSGFLVESPGHLVTRDQLLSCRGLRYRSRIAGRWEEFQFESADALAGEDSVGVTGPFHYPVVIRRSGSRVLVLSSHKEIADHLITAKFRDLFRPRLRRVTIGVDQLVKALTMRPTTYAISYVHSRVPAFGAVLRAISFYGDDLGQASLFRNNVDLMAFYTCGLRQSTGGNEIVRLGAEGGVSFYLHTPEKVIEVEEVLRFLNSFGYLETRLVDPPTDSDDVSSWEDR